MAVIMRLAFHGLLRISEALALVVEDIVLPSGIVSGRSMVLAIRLPKNRRYAGRAQFVTISDEGCIEWTRWLMKDMIPGSKLWPSASQFFVKISNFAY